MADNHIPPTMHTLTNNIINLLLANIKFDIATINSAGPLELYFPALTFRFSIVNGSRNIEVDIHDKELLNDFKTACTNFPYPGLIISKPIGHNMSQSIREAYNAYLSEAFHINANYDTVFYDILPMTFTIAGVDNVPAHVYNAIKTRTHLPEVPVEKYYYRVMPNGMVVRYVSTIL
jgi:hypothetical protein